MAINKVDNVWGAGVQPPPKLVDVLTEAAASTPPSAPSTPVNEQTDEAEIDTIPVQSNYRIAEQMDRVADAALVASEQSLDVVQVAQEAELNAHAVTQATENSVAEAQIAIEQTQNFIATTNQAAERAIHAARTARQASLTAFEFTRSSASDLEEVEVSINSSEQRMQNIDSNKLFQRTQNLKQQTAALREQLNNI